MGEEAIIAKTLRDGESFQKGDSFKKFAKLRKN